MKYLLHVTMRWYAMRVRNGMLEGPPSEISLRATCLLFPSFLLKVRNTGRGQQLVIQRARERTAAVHHTTW